MASNKSSSASPQGPSRHTPFVSSETSMREFTVRAFLLGIAMCVVLGAANAYLGLRAGMTIAATYPAAVIAMAVLRVRGGTILEENFARTIGSVGESVAAGAIFTLPAFVILHLWTFDTLKDYLEASALLVVGGILGVLFVTLLRRVMVEDPELPFPESVAAAEIHKAGQRGSGAAAQLFQAMGVGALIKLLGDLKVFLASNDFVVKVGELGHSMVRLGYRKEDYVIPAGGVSVVSAPAVSPAYMGVGYIIGPVLGAINFAGGLLAWGLFVPLLLFFLGPHVIDGFQASLQAADPSITREVAWVKLADLVWKSIVKPIAVGGMLVGAAFTLWSMRANLMLGLRRGIADLKKSAEAEKTTDRIEHDLSFRAILFGIAAVFVLMLGLYLYFTGVIGGTLLAGVVMLVTGFFFAAVSGNLVGLIGSSNNPISGLTLATLIVAALTLLIAGVSGDRGVIAVLGVAAIVCVSSAVAGDMIQDLKVGHILGGTPWRMEVGEMAGAVVAGLVMFFPLLMLHTANIKQGGIGFGDKQLSAPQAGLMATLSQGIMGGEMAWPLVVVGVALGISLILVRVKSPMLFAVGMYLPLETTFAIFIGGIVRGVVDAIVRRRRYNEAQQARVENTGVLVSSGLIAGEALMGLLIAAVVFWRNSFPELNLLYARPLAVVVALVLVAYMIALPLRKAGSADEPAPPHAM